MHHFICFFSFLLYLSFFNNASCQNLCVRKEISERLVPKRIVYTYTETYRPKCFLSVRCPIKSRIKIGMRWTQINEPVERNVSYCCPGYTRSDDTINCIPICMPACTNSVCTVPGKCSCNSGHIADEAKPHHCQPVCISGCSHGKCVSPDVCECDFGYILSNGSCMPICTEPCLNGKCVAPETCECQSGYRQSTNNVCQPYCFKGCIHGKCIAPETCECEENYYLKDGNCLPICSQPCGNGTCTEPEVCECFPGYKIDLRTEFNESICVPSCKCNGTCIAPNNCLCHPPNIAKHLTANDEDCDCFSNCTNVSRVCEKMICVPDAIEFIDDELDNKSSTTTELISIEVMTTESTDNDFIDYKNTNINDTVGEYVAIAEASSETTWIIIGVLCALTLIIFTILIVMRKYISNYFATGDYVIEDKYSEIQFKDEIYYEVSKH